MGCSLKLTFYQMNGLLILYRDLIWNDVQQMYLLTTSVICFVENKNRAQG